jgi:hypothetical protein
MRYLALVLPLLASLSSVIAQVAQGAAGTSTKTLLVDRPLSNDPVTIVKVMEGTTELKSDGHPFPNKYVWEAAFDAGDGWLKDLSFTIRNISEKKIIYVSVGCSLYETADWQAEIAKHRTSPILGHTSNTVGRRPEQALYSASLGHRLKPDAATAPFELAPGQEFTVPIEKPDDYQALKSGIEEKQPVSSVTACNGGISQIFFEDGTQWQGHRYLRADPDQLGHWIRMSLEEWSSAKKSAE